MFNHRSRMIRLILDLDQTAELVRQAGGESHHGRVLAIVSPGSYPTAAGRLVLHLIECSSIATANDAVSVATGRATVRRVKSPKQAPDAPQAILEGQKAQNLAKANFELNAPPI